MVMRVSSTARSNFSGVGAEAGRQAVHQERHGDLGDDGQRQDHEHQAGQRLLGEGARGLLALALELLGEQRHERRVEGALAEQAAEQVGEAEGHEEGVGHRPGAEHGGDQNVAHEAEHAADHGQAADGGEGAVELHGGRGVAERGAKSKARLEARAACNGIRIEIRC